MQFSITRNSLYIVEHFPLLHRFSCVCFFTILRGWVFVVTTIQALGRGVRGRPDASPNEGLGDDLVRGALGRIIGEVQHLLAWPRSFSGAQLRCVIVI